MIYYLFSYLGIFFITYFGVLFFIRWGKKKNLLDVPNERSSHLEPTPRGGGIIILAVSLIAFFIFLLCLNEKFIWSYFAGAIIVAGVSWLDDLKTISPIWRFLCHSLAAFLVIWELGGLTNFYLPTGGVFNFGFWGTGFTFLWIIWLINAYNFMDGIDGIAAVQAITAGIGWFLIGNYGGFEVVGFYGGVLAFSALGFLVHNWTPAKVFMGDVGSAFLGFSFAVLPLFLRGKSQFEEYLPWIGLILVWFFVFDSVLTFSMRVVRRERFWQPHRQHIYQQLVISGISHISITLIYGFLSALLIICSFIILKFINDGLKWILLVVFLESTSLFLFLIYRKSVITK